MAGIRKNTKKEDGGRGVVICCAEGGVTSEGETQKNDRVSGIRGGGKFLELRGGEQRKV